MTLNNDSDMFPSPSVGSAPLATLSPEGEGSKPFSHWEKGGG
jgi:hypothetical protein